MTVSPSVLGSGISSMKPKRRRKAVSSKAIERSAVFIVPTMNTFSGTTKRSPLSGSSTAEPRFGLSKSVSNSPKIRGMSPRLISSTIR